MLSSEVVPVDKPDDVNVVIGQAHFIRRSTTSTRRWWGEPVSAVLGSTGEMAHP